MRAIVGIDDVGLVVGIYGYPAVIVSLVLVGDILSYPYRRTLPVGYLLLGRERAPTTPLPGEMNSAKFVHSHRHAYLGLSHIGNTFNGLPDPGYFRPKLDIEHSGIGTPAKAVPRDEDIALSIRADGRVILSRVSYIEESYRLFGIPSPNGTPPVKHAPACCKRSPPG